MSNPPRTLTCQHLSRGVALAISHLRPPRVTLHGKDGRVPLLSVGKLVGSLPHESCPQKKKHTVRLLREGAGVSSAG